MWATLGEGLRVCGYERCGKSFAAPLRLTDLSHKPHSETYDACPYCFSKMDESDVDVLTQSRPMKSGGYGIAAKSHESGVKAGAIDHAGRDAPVAKCPHQVGYLKTRSKNEAVPDSCLTCPRILQCMV